MAARYHILRALSHFYFATGSLLGGLLPRTLCERRLSARWRVLDGPKERIP